MATPRATVPHASRGSGASSGLPDDRLPADQGRGAPAARIGKSYRIREQDVDRYLEARFHDVG